MIFAVGLNRPLNAVDLKAWMLRTFFAKDRDVSRFR
jgi:hypothetical protein